MDSDTFELEVDSVPLESEVDSVDPLELEVDSVLLEGEDDSAPLESDKDSVPLEPEVDSFLSKEDVDFAFLDWKDRTIEPDLLDGEGLILFTPRSCPLLSSSLKF